MPRTNTLTHQTTGAQLVTGQDFRALRLLAIHASAREVASLLGCHPLTLVALERSAAPVEEPRAEAWRRALGLAAAARRTALAKEGITDDQIAGTDFGRAYRALTATKGARG